MCMTLDRLEGFPRLNGKHAIMRSATNKTFKPLETGVQIGDLTMYAVGSHNHEAGRRDVIPGIVSFGFWQAQGVHDSRSEPHYNDSVHFMMSLQGQTSAVLDDKVYTLKPEALMVTRPWQKHAVGYPSFSQGQLGWLTLDVGIRNPHEKWKWPEWVLLSKDELSVITRELRQNEDALRLVSPACVAAFAALVHYAKDPDAAKNKTWIALLANTLFFRLHETFAQAAATYSTSLTEAARSVEMFLSRLPTMLVEPWTVDRMARQCGVGLTYFSSQVIMLTGETPAKYLLRLRMKRAQELLKETNCSLREICTQTGFGGESHFVQQFGKRFGETPNAWRLKA